eukprot:SAG11_NODE_872_length_6802_cov_8.951514_2_plen_214_part_00
MRSMPALIVAHIVGMMAAAATQGGPIASLTRSTTPQAQRSVGPPPSQPVLIVRGPYTVNFTRANGHQPFISSHFPAGHDGRSAFNFNLVPAYLRLPDGHDALIVRSVNGTSWSKGTTSTTLNPDKLTLTSFREPDGASDTDHISVHPISADSVVLEPSGKAEACGVQVLRSVASALDLVVHPAGCCGLTSVTPLVVELRRHAEINPSGLSLTG